MEVNFKANKISSYILFDKTHTLSFCNILSLNLAISQFYLLYIILKPLLKLAIFPNTDSWRLGCKLINSVAMHFVVLPLPTVSGSVTPSHSTKDDFTQRFIIIQVADIDRPIRINILSPTQFKPIFGNSSKIDYFVLNFMNITPANAGRSTLKNKRFFLLFNCSNNFFRCQFEK